MLVADAELVIGLVGRMGVDVPSLLVTLTRQLHALHYQHRTIKVTDFLLTKDFKLDLLQDPIEERYKSYILGCNSIREKAGRNDFFVSYIVQQIINERQALTGDPDVPAPRMAYIVNQLKRPEEAQALREIYGQQFILISCHMPRDLRRDALARRIAQGHANLPKASDWTAVADDLIKVDDKESAKPYGQRVSDVFPQADLIIDTSENRQSEELVRRFFEALFGNFKISPTRDEFFQNLAMQVSLTSCDTARQVGAAIAKDGEIKVTGFNEAPRAGGGTYWSDEGHDARDVALGNDANTIRKRQMVADIILCLRDAKMLADNEIKDHEIEQIFLDGNDAPLRKSQIMDTLEYGRAVHAEMAALSAASRQGISVLDATLYCTTFPCHNCAKHIVAAGISHVYYLEPYAKSFADELYPDSISIDSAGAAKEKISFSQFVGITPNRFRSIFSKSKLKDERGKVVPWNPKDSQPILEKLDQAHTVREVFFQKRMRDSMSFETAAYLGLESEDAVEVPIAMGDDQRS